MIDLSKIEAQHLDDLFNYLLSYKGETVFGFYETITLSKNVDSLKDKDSYYIETLLYKVRVIQKDIPALISGTDALMVVHMESIKGFLLLGGFINYYKTHRHKKLHERWQFWLAILGAILAAIALL
jgi:hypothetical protein